MHLTALDNKDHSREENLMEKLLFTKKEAGGALNICPRSVDYLIENKVIKLVRPFGL
jgi:hypothetical protein